MNQKLPDRETAVLDFEGLLERCMGNLEFAERILSKFQQRFGEELAELETELERDNAEGITRIAHRLNGESANVAAERLQASAAMIETLGRAERISEIPPCLEELRGEWSRFVDSLSSLSSSGGARR